MGSIILTHEEPINPSGGISVILGGLGAHATCDEDGETDDEGTGDEDC